MKNTKDIAEESLKKDRNRNPSVLRVGILYSGGKDSTYAAYIAEQRDRPECLVTIRPLSEESYMFHFPNVSMTKLQSQAMRLPQVLLNTEGIKEAELNDLRKAIQLAIDSYDIQGLYTGALASVYQKSRVDRICSELRIECISPLWLIDPETHLRNLIANNFHTIITGVAALGLDESWLGRKIDEKMVEELVKLHAKYGLHVGLEGGEGETFVLDCPLFDKRIEVVSSEKHWRGDSGFLMIKEARLVAK